MERIQPRGGCGKLEAILKSAGYSTEAISDSPSRFYQAWTIPQTNYVGTALFLSYIPAVLYLTYFLVLKDIRPRWLKANEKFAGSKKDEVIDVPCNDQLLGAVL